MPNERRQEVWATMQPLQLAHHRLAQLGRILRREVRQPAVPDVTSHPLVRVRLGLIAGQRHHLDRGVVDQVGLHDLRPADGVGADGRDSVVPVPAPDRRLAARGERAPHGRGEHESRLVEGHQVRPAPASAADDPWQLLTPSVGDGGLVPLSGPPLRLLAGPAELALEDLADVLRVEGDAEVALDQLGHPGGGPKYGPAAVGLGSLEQLHQPLPGRFAEPWLASGLAAAEEAGDVLGDSPLFNQLDGPEAAALEFFGGSAGSHSFGTDLHGSWFS